MRAITSDNFVLEMRDADSWDEAAKQIISAKSLEQAIDIAKKRAEEWVTGGEWDLDNDVITVKVNIRISRKSDGVEVFAGRKNCVVDARR